MPSGSQSRGKRRQNSRRHAPAPHGMGQLDVVSADPDPQPQQDSHQTSPSMAAAGQRPQRVPTPHASQDYGNVSDDDLLQLADDFFQGNDGAGANVSRQSSPAISKVADTLWKTAANYSDDDYELPATSSPKNDNLPDTLPLQQAEHVDPDIASDIRKHSPVDLSETATTARRSPSLRPSEAQEYQWEYLSSRATSKHPAKDHDQSSAAGEELPAVDFSIAKVARVKKAPDTDDGEQSPEQQLESKDSEPSRAESGAKIDSHDDSGAPEKTDSEKSQTPAKVIMGQRAQPAPADDKSLHRKPLKDTTRASANKTAPQESSRSSVKQSTQGPSPTSPTTSGKKRKQRAKDPVVFDAVTQEVKEGPPQKKKKSPGAPHSAAKAVEKFAPASKTPAISKKRPVPKVSRKPAKKAKTEPQPKQPLPNRSPKRTSHRAAAQAAQAAVRQQLTSSPCPDAQAPGAPESDDHGRKPVVEQVAEPSSPEKGAPSLKPPSRKGFGGASDRMYTAEPKLQTIRDSQSDTQDLIRAHLAEEQVTDNYISISSDQSSEANDVEPLVSLPKVVQSLGEHGNRKRASQTQPQAADITVSTRAETSAHQASVKNTIAAATEIKNVRKQHDHCPPNGEYGLSLRAAHVPSQAPRSVAKSQEHAAEPKSNSSRRRSQANLRPDDAFVNNHPLEDRGRARTKSTWNRTLSVSQQGSPSRLRNGENEHRNAGSQGPIDEPSASSAVMKDCLGHSSQRSPHPVSRRLSYHPVPIEAKQPESAKNAPQSGLTGEILVDSRASKGQTSKPSASRDGITPADALKIKNKIYDQILLAERAEELPPQTPEPIQVQEKTSPMGARRRHVADQLDTIVHMITQRLYESEQGLDDTVEAYETGTSKCVQRIQHRLDREHRKLLEQWKSHCQLFSRSVEKAQQPIRDTATARRDSAREPEQALAKRQRLYDQASMSLRTFHNQVMLK